MAYDFPASPTIGQTFNNYVWDGEKWKLQSPPVTGAVRYDIAQGLNPTQKAQGRANIDVARKNYIINGAMMVSQENGGTSSGALGSYYPADQFWVEVGTSGNVHTSQIAKPTPAGSPNRLRVTVGVIDATVNVADRVQIIHYIEGLRVADLKFGSAQAKTVTLQFGICAPTGTYCVSIGNAANRIYVTECVISAGEANTDVVKTITIPGDTTGTWKSDNTASFDVRWILMAGSNFQGATLNAWAANVQIATTNQFNIAGSTSNIFELFDVSLTEGSVAPPFQVPDYADELAACQRYWMDLGIASHDFNAAGATVFDYQFIGLPVAMRTGPTALLGAPAGGQSNVSTVILGDAVPTKIGLRATSAAAGRAYYLNYTVKVSARL